MKFHLILILLLIATKSFSQTEYKPDQRTSEQKLNLSNSNINKTDIINLLEFGGLQINKFEIGKFDRKLSIQFIMEEFIDSKRVSVDTFAISGNTYIYNLEGNWYFDYIESFEILTKDPIENKAQIKFITAEMSTTKYLQLNNLKEGSFTNYRRYKDAKWQLNKKVPLLVFASSWYDKDINANRFCGANYLEENSEPTKELFEKSPNYIVFSYAVTE